MRLWWHDQPPRRSWVIEARALAWQTIKEGGRTWCSLAAIGLVIPMLFLLRWGYDTLRGYAMASEWLLLISIGIALVAGANVFGLENRARTQRFLTHHGARPGLVWLVKLAVWGVGLAAIWGTLAIMGLMAIWGPLALTGKIALGDIDVGRIENWLHGIWMVSLFFGIAQLCGMAIRRGITAVVIGLVIGLVLTITLLLRLIETHMLPVQGLLTIPVGLLVVSWAWSGDWLLDRPAPGRWIRLGILLTGLFTLLVSWYAGYRAWSIPDLGPIAPPAAWLEAASNPLPTDQNAAELYREAGRRLVGPFMDSSEFLDRNRELLDLLRRAAAKPHCRFLQPEKLTVLDQLDLPPVGQLAMLLALDANERQDHGDLAGAWNDIEALCRMARHGGEGTGLMATLSSVAWVEQTALGVALEWAVDHGQTPDRLHAALIAYHDLPKIPAAADTVRAEANMVENTLDLPATRLRDWVFESGHGSIRSQPVFASILFDLATMPWERVCARRVNRLITRAAIQATMRDPWQRPHVPNIEIDYAQKTSRNAMMLMRGVERYIEANDRNEVARRAFVSVLALREWQLRHGGQFPKSLDALVPEQLTSLPLDPYSGQPFGYARSQGQEVPSLRYVLGAAPGKGHNSTPGSWLLYSVGPNRSDDGGLTFKKNDRRVQPVQPLDIVFEIPPVEGQTVPSKGQDHARSEGHERDQNSPKDRPAPAGPAAAHSPRL